MMHRRRKRAPGGGRKPAGDGGVRVRDLPGLQLRLPVYTVARLKALSAARGVPVWRLVDSACRAYLGALRGLEAGEVGRRAKREATRLRAKYPDAET